MLKKTTKELCALCKGVRKLCGASVCPILAKKAIIYQSEIPRELVKEEVAGYSEWALVGEYGYPKVRLGPLSAVSAVPWKPEYWAEKRLDFSQILRFRIASLYPFRFWKIHKPPDPSSPLGESLLSIKPILVELKLRKPPKIQLKLDADIPPFGGSAPLQKIDLGENPKIPRKVDSLILESVKASEGVVELRKAGLSVYYIQKLFSVGFLGSPINRRVVPTRWSITAVDSIVGNSNLRKVRYSPSFAQSQLYHWEYLGNRYYIIIIPSDFWYMEMFEIWLPNSVWLFGSGKPVVIHVYEDYTMKPNKMDGGYYAIRTPVSEWLARNNRKAAVLAIRVITPQYIAPVGSWQIRESVRLALKNGPIMTAEVSELLEYIVQREPVLNSVDIPRKSKLLQVMRHPKITQFL